MKARRFVLVAGFVASAGCQPSPEELARREAAAKAQAQLAEQERASKAKAREDARASQRKQHEEALAALRATYAEKTAAEREKILRDLCARAAACTPEARATVVSAAGSEAERRKLGTLADQFGERFDATARESFMAEIAAEYVPSSMQPVITNRSSGKMFLIIHGLYCSDERTEDFASGPRALQAVALGYDRIVCSGPKESWERDLR